MPVLNFPTALISLQSLPAVWRQDLKQGKPSLSPSPNEPFIRVVNADSSFCPTQDVEASMLTLKRSPQDIEASMLTLKERLRERDTQKRDLLNELMEVATSPIMHFTNNF